MNFQKPATPEAYRTFLASTIDEAKLSPSCREGLLLLLVVVVVVVVVVDDSDVLVVELFIMGILVNGTGVFIEATIHDPAD